MPTQPNATRPTSARPVAAAAAAAPSTTRPAAEAPASAPVDAPSPGPVDVLVPVPRAAPTGAAPAPAVGPPPPPPPPSGPGRAPGAAAGPSEVEALAAQMAVLDGLREDPGAFEAACRRLDAAKAAGLAALAAAADVDAAARALAARVEGVHGKPGQAQRAARVAQRLLARPEVSCLLAPESPRRAALSAYVLDAIAYLNLGDVEGPTALYLATGRPAPAALATFAGRPARAFAIMEAHGIAEAETRRLVRASHVDGGAGAERDLAAQLVDASERLAAMTAARPQRPALPEAKVAAILRELGDRGALDPRLAEAAAQAVSAGALRDV